MSSVHEASRFEAMMRGALGPFPAAKSNPYLVQAARATANRIAGAADVWWLSHRLALEEEVECRPTDVVGELVDHALSGDSDSAYKLLQMAKWADSAAEELTDAFKASEFMPLIS